MFARFPKGVAAMFAEERRGGGRRSLPRLGHDETFGLEASRTSQFALNKKAHKCHDGAEKERL